MSASSDYLQWRRGPPIGCVFARLMSTRPHDFGQMVEEIPGRAPFEVADVIAARTDECLSDPQVLAAAFVLTGIDTLDQLTDMALALAQSPNWFLSTAKLEPPPNLDLVTVRIVRDIPFGEKTCPSEALIMGPYDEFPNTRRAPATAFEIFVGEPAPQDPKTHRPTTKANFAHIDLRDRELIKRDFTQEAIDSMWARSRIGRSESLGGIKDNRAKAKVSFVIPTALAAEKGCAS